MVVKMSRQKLSVGRQNHQNVVKSVRRPCRRNASPRRVAKIFYNPYQIYVIAFHMAKTAAAIHQLYVVVGVLQSIDLKVAWIA